MSLNDAEPRSTIQAASAIGQRSSGFMAAALIGLFMFLVMAGRPINIDTAWYLVAIEKWLGGATLYVDLLEVNPPLAFYLALPGVLLADLLGIAVTDGMFLYVAILVAGGLAWVWSLVLRSDLGWSDRWTVLAAAAVAMLVAPKFYGQREHLLVVLAMPWFVSHLLGRTQSGLAAVARTSVASLGFCLKPHFLLIPVCLTVAECLRSRSLRPVVSGSNVTIVMAGLVYVSLAALLHPAYFTQIIPIALDVYAEYSFGGATVLWTAQLWLPVLFLVVAFEGRRKGVTAVAPIVAAVVGALAAYFAQWNGFPYHLLPALSAMCFGWLWLATRSQAGTPVRLMAAGSLLALAVQNAGFHEDRFGEELAARATELPQPIRYMAYSTALDAAFPFVLTAGADWTGRGPALWFLPAVVNGLEAKRCEPDAERCARLREIERIMRDHVFEDATRNDPNVLVFPKHNFFLWDPRFDIRAYLERDPRFRSWMGGFELVEDGPGYSLWVRR